MKTLKLGEKTYPEIDSSDLEDGQFAIIECCSGMRAFKITRNVFNDTLQFEDDRSIIPLKDWVNYTNGPIFEATEDDYEKGLPGE